MPPVESSPRIEEQENKVNFFSAVKTINNSPQKEKLAKGGVFDLANTINKTEEAKAEFNIQPKRVSKGTEYEPSVIHA
jgi:hypothetical protein